MVENVESSRRAQVIPLFSFGVLHSNNNVMMKNKSIKMLKSTSEPDKEESLYIEDDDESIKK